MSVRLKRFVVSLLLAPAALLVTEGAVQAFKLHQVGAPRSDIVAADYMPTRVRPDYEGELDGLDWSTNAQGFREAVAVPRQPAPGEYRVLVAGDSVGMGFGVSRDAAFPRRLEARLEVRGRSPVRVVNTSGQGYSPSSYLVYLKHEGLQFQPDAVIIGVELCNDLTDEALLRWGPRGSDGLPESVLGGRYVVSWDGNLLGTAARGPAWFERTYTWTLLLRQGLRLAHRIWPRPPFDGEQGIPYYHFEWERFLLDQQRLDAGFHRLFDALAGIDLLVESRGVPVLVALLPARFQFEDSGSYSRLATELYRRAVNEAERRQLAVLDLSPVMAAAGGAQRYLDFAHPDAAGHEAIAKALADAVLGLEDP